MKVFFKVFKFFSSGIFEALLFVRLVAHFRAEPLKLLEHKATEPMPLAGLIAWPATFCNHEWQLRSFAVSLQSCGRSGLPEPGFQASAAANLQFLKCLSLSCCYSQAASCCMLTQASAPPKFYELKLSKKCPRQLAKHLALQTLHAFDAKAHSLRR